MSSGDGSDHGWWEVADGAMQSEPVGDSDFETTGGDDLGEVIRLGETSELGAATEAESGSGPLEARILWPALGFPAVIAPRAGATGTPLVAGDASRCVTVLLLSNRKHLSAAEVADHLRALPWRDRAGAAGAGVRFEAHELSVRNDASEPALTMPGSGDDFGELVAFGGDADGERAIAVTLAKRVREFYRGIGLAWLHEARVSEQASARLADGLYQLVWAAAGGDELAVLRDRFAAPRRAALGAFGTTNRQFLLDEYEFEFGPLHPMTGQPVRGRRMPILHPLFVRRRQAATLRIGHITDTHVSVRADVYAHNLSRSGKQLAYNNWNDSVRQGYARARADSDVILLTGDLVDYGRGHWGRDAAQRLDRDELYHVDRNWFLFHEVLAGGDAYSVPVYTILGNHDWRINPYPPFAIGAPSPRLFIHDHRRHTTAEQRRMLESAHGPGFDRRLSYEAKSESRIRGLLDKAGTMLKALGALLVQTRSLDIPGSPAETTVESVAWYLLAINPFLDFSFTLPGGHRVLMLDWAESEDVLFPIVYKGQEWPYMLWQLDTASDPGPKAKRVLTPRQRRLVTELVESPGTAKVIGIHAPPIGPYPDWRDPDTLRGRKTYANPRAARGPTHYATKRPDGTIDQWNGHPIFAVRPRNGDAGVEADYGSFTQGREWFIRTVGAPRSGVRAVFSGHIHRNGLYVVHAGGKERGALLENELLVRQVVEPAVRGAAPPAVSRTPEGGRGPLYVNTTSAGPRGNDLTREPTDAERQHGGLSVDPGWARLDLRSDGTIERAEFRPSIAPPAGAPREVAPFAAPESTAGSLFDQAAFERLFGGEEERVAVSPGAPLSPRGDDDLEARIERLLAGDAEDGGERPRHDEPVEAMLGLIADS